MYFKIYYNTSGIKKGIAANIISSKSIRVMFITHISYLIYKTK